jgi:uncharacterized protein GlcG (DUF336 family)
MWRRHGIERGTTLRFTSTLLSGALVSAVSFAADAQVLTERNISIQLARTLGDAAIAACKADGYDVTVAVVDRAGDLKLLLRADSANPHNADLARRKAYTARTFGVPSMEFAKRTSGTTDLSGQRELAEVVPLGGGLPIVVGTERIGGLGLSGAPTQEADEKCAKAALTAAANSLK